MALLPLKLKFTTASHALTTTEASISQFRFQGN